jgi:HK97 family phage major capsid protein
MDKIKTVHDEMAEANARIQQLVALATTEDRDFTPEEEKEKGELLARMQLLDGKRRRGESFADLLKNVSTLAPPPPAGPGPRNGIIHEPSLAAAKSLGQQFVEHQVYAHAMKGVQRSGQWVSPAFELQAAGVTLTPSGAAIPPGTQPPLPFTLPPEWSVADRFAQGTTDAGLVPYLRETVWTNAAAVVAMGGPKPQSTKTFDLVQQPLIKIAHYIDCPDELLDDVAGLQSFINAQMALGVREKLEHEIINGPGGAGQMQGLLTLPGIAPPVVWTAGPYLSAIITQYAQVYELSRLRPDTVVMSPSTWAVVVTQTSTAGGFLLPPGIVLGAEPSIYGMALVQTPEVPDGTAIVGAFGQASNFASNITSIRAELRVALAIYRSAAFGLVTGVVIAP